MDILRGKVEDFITRNVKLHSVHYENSERISIEGPISMDDLIVLDGSLDGKKVRVLKDVGCSTNVVSQEFARKIAKTSTGSSVMLK